MYQAIWGGRRKGQHRSYCFIHLSNSVTGDGTTETILIHHICWNPPRRNSLPPIIFPREMLAARIASSKNDRQKTIYCPDSTASLSENKQTKIHFCPILLRLLYRGLSHRNQFLITSPFTLVRESRRDAQRGEGEAAEAPSQYLAFRVWIWEDLIKLSTVLTSGR